MANESTISKWGNSLAVRIPLAIAKQAGLGEGDRVTVAMDQSGSIVLRPARRCKRRYSDETMEEVRAKLGSLLGTEVNDLGRLFRGSKRAGRNSTLWRKPLIIGLAA